MRAGLGAMAAAGGGFTFTGESKQKTVGPSRVKIRKIEGPGLPGTLSDIAFMACTLKYNK